MIGEFGTCIGLCRYAPREFGTCIGLCRYAPREFGTLDLQALVS